MLNTDLISSPVWLDDTCAVEIGCYNKPDLNIK